MTSLGVFLLTGAVYGSYLPDQYPAVFALACLVPWCNAVVNPMILVVRGSRLREGVVRGISAANSKIGTSSHAL